MAWDEANYWCKIYLHFSQHIGDKLTSNDLGCVLEEVLDVSAEWYPLGLQLKVRTGTLDRIREQFPHPRDQLLEMLKTWLITSDNTSWKTLIDALRSQSVGASQLARVLETKYYLVEGTEVGTGTYTSESQPETTVFPSFSQPAISYILAASVAPLSPYTFLPLSSTPSHI